MNQFSFQQELLRKFLHLSVLIFPILLLRYGKNNCLPYFFVISFLFLLMDIFRLKYKQIQLLYDRYFGAVTKKYERNYKFYYGGQAYVTGAVPRMVSQEVQVLLLYGVLLMSLILYLNIITETLTLLPCVICLDNKGCIVYLTCC